MPKIIVSIDGQVLQEVVLATEQTTIGRGPQNDIVLQMRSVSARHAVITMNPQDCFVEDLDSTNGTQVNGQPIRKHYLQHNDVIRMSGYELRYESAAPPVSQILHDSPIDASPAGQPDPFQVDADKDDDADVDVDAQRGQTAIAGATASAPVPIPVIRVLTGPSAGDEILLTKSLTTIGCPGVQVAVITRRPQGFLITHVEGDCYPLVNGISVGAGAYPIESGNVLDLSGTEVEFLLR